MTTADKTYLLNPGPVNLSQRVRTAMLQPDLCHREPEYADLQSDVRERLTRVYEDTVGEYTAVLLTGSGTAAVEAMVGSLVPGSGKALVAANGVYGERMAAMLQAQGKAFDLVRADWLDPIDLDAVARKLAEDRAITHVAAVHHETTTGRLNDLSRLSEICRERNVPLLLDAVSSFGGEPLDLLQSNVDACAATANKCLHGVPGVSFVLVRKDALAAGASGATSLYLDLQRNYEEQRQGLPFTPAVHAVYALREALSELSDRGGWRQRHRDYGRLSALVREGLQARGYRLLLPDERSHSSVLTSFRVPPGVDYDQLQAKLKRDGYVIYAGQRSLQGKIFRIAVMGELGDDAIERLIESFPRIGEAAPAGSKEAPACV